MGNLTVLRKNFEFQYRGAAPLTLNLANAPWLANVRKIYRASPGTALALQSYNGAYSGATPGGAVTVLTPGYCYRMVAGVYDGSWSIPDSILVDEIPTSAQVASSFPSSLGYYLEATGADQTDAIQSLVVTSTAAGKPLFLNNAGKTFYYRDTVASNSSYSVGIELFDNSQVFGFGPASTTLQALPSPAGVYKNETYGNGAPDTNGKFGWAFWSNNRSNIRIKGISFNGNLTDKIAKGVVGPVRTDGGQRIPHGYFNSYGTIFNGHWWETGGVYFEGGSNNRIDDCNFTQFNGRALRWDSSPNGVGNHISADNCVSAGINFSQFASGGSVTCAGTVITGVLIDSIYADGISFNSNGVTVQNGTVSNTRICQPINGVTIANFAGVYGQASTGNTIISINCKDCSSYGFDFWDGEGTDRSWQLDGGVQRNSSNPTGNIMLNCSATTCGNGGFRLYQSGLQLLNRSASIDNGKRSSDAFVDPWIRFPYGAVIPAGITKVIIQDFIVRSSNGMTTFGVAGETPGTPMKGCTITDSHFEVATPLGAYDNTCTVDRNYTGAGQSGGTGGTGGNAGGVYDPNQTGTPLAKTTLTTTRVSSTYIQATWTAVQNATLYNLWYSPTVNYSDGRSIYHGTDLLFNFPDTGVGHYWIAASASGYKNSLSDPAVTPAGSGYGASDIISPLRLEETDSHTYLGPNPSDWAIQTAAAYSFSGGKAYSLDGKSGSFLIGNTYCRYIRLRYMGRNDGSSMALAWDQGSGNPSNFVTLTNPGGDYVMLDWVVDTGSYSIKPQLGFYFSQGPGGISTLIDYVDIY
jgi:hypothetical protein